MIFIPFAFLFVAISVIWLWMRSTKNKYKRTYFITGCVLIFGLFSVIWGWVANSNITMYSSPKEAFQRQHNQNPTEIVYGKNSAMAFLNETTYEIYEKNTRGWYQRNSIFSMGFNQVFFQRDQDFIVDIIKDSHSNDIYVMIYQYRASMEELLDMKIQDNYCSVFEVSPLVQLKENNQTRVFQRYVAAITYEDDIYKLTINEKSYHFDMTDGKIRFLPFRVEQ